MIGQVPLGEKVLPLLRCSPEDQTSHSHLGAALWVYGAAWVQWLFRCLSEAVASVAVGGSQRERFATVAARYLARTPPLKTLPGSAL